MVKKYLKMLTLPLFLTGAVITTCETVTVHTDASSVTVSAPLFAIATVYQGALSEKSCHVAVPQSNEKIVKKHVLSAISMLCSWGSIISMFASIGGALDFIFHEKFGPRLYVALPLMIIFSKISDVCNEMAQPLVQIKKENNA